MTPYDHGDQESGVVAYAAGANSITLQFREGAVYVYDYEVTGREHVERMKELAVSGRGLATYVSQRVRTAYARRLK